MKNTRRQILLGLAPAAGAVAAPAPNRAAAVRSALFNVRDYGAVGDGTRMNTKAIQDAVDACARAGGGTVLIPAGRYLSSTIVLQSHVMIELASGATLLGSSNLADFPVHVPKRRSYTDVYVDRSLIYAENAENIGICGRGTIDGQGAAYKDRRYMIRPYIIRCIECRGVSVSGVTILNSPMWVQHYLACDDVSIHGISVHSVVNANNDGIDIDCCQRVRISDCEIVSGDDAIVLKATSDRPCRDVTVTNCVLSTRCNALKLGTESNGGFENIAISNCTIYDTRLAGIALEMVDGGRLDRVAISNIAMHNVSAPIFIRLGDRGRPFVTGGPRPPAGSLANVVISNVEAVSSRVTGCAIAGLAGHAMENVTLENIRLVFPGGGTAADARRAVPENADKYPEYAMFGTLPAYAFYCRHVKGLRLRNIVTRFDGAEERPALVCDDVEGLDLADSAFAGAAEGEPAIRFADVRDAFVHGCRTPAAVQTWLQVTGGASGRITVMGNDLQRAAKAVDATAGVPDGAVFQEGNRLKAG